MLACNGTLTLLEHNQCVPEGTHQNSMDQIFSNAYGTVYKDRVTYIRGKGIFAGGSEEDVPMRHITSVRYDVDRRPVVSIIIIFIGVVALVDFSGWIANLIGLGMIVIGGIAIQGTPSVTVTTLGGDKEVMLGTPLTKKEARDFVKALKSQLFTEAGDEE